MRISIIGSGHVGLVTGACFANLGHQVTCVDNDGAKIETLKAGLVPFYEPGLQELVRRNMEEERLGFTTSIPQGVEKGDVIFISVNTPSLPDGAPDLSFVEKVSRDIAGSLNEYRLVVEKSTVPARTGEWVKRTLHLYGNGKADFDVASVPEFLREGCAVQDFLHPDRVVIGVETPRAEKILRHLFEPLGAPLVITDINSAELIKHASNSFLAMKISYANALATLCERVGADVTRVVEGMGHDTRIGRDFLSAGVGYGGACFPKDVAAFIRIAQDAGYDFRLLKAVQQINYDQKVRLVDKIKGALWVLRDKTIAILGLSFKPNTDDMRNAPSIDVVNMLLAEGARIQAYDPAAMETARSVLGDSIAYCADAYRAAQDAHALVLLTEWDEFRELDMERIKDALAIPVLIDGRNLFDPGAMKGLGFQYHGVGR